MSGPILNRKRPALKNRRLYIQCISMASLLLWLTSCTSTPPAEKVVKLEVIQRKDWAPLSSTKAANALPMGQVTRITVHHDGIDPPADLGTYEQVLAHVQSIQQYHLSRGWADIGYHFIIDPSGRVWKGRPLSWQGAHVSGDNEENIGIVLLGNFQKQHPSEKSLESLGVLIKGLKERYQVQDYRVYTHRELSGKTECPGDHLQAVVDRVR